MTRWHAHRTNIDVPNIALGVMMDRCGRLRSVMGAKPSRVGFVRVAARHVPRGEVLITLHVLLIVYSICLSIGCQAIVADTKSAE